MSPRILEGHRYWKFRPDPLLTELRDHPPERIAHMEKKLLAAKPLEGFELGHKNRDQIHPLLRDRLPASSRVPDFQRVAESLERARRISEAGFSGTHFNPAVVDLGLLAREGRLGEAYTVKTFVDIPGHEQRLIMPVTYVMRKPGDNYVIEAFGMQRSDERETIPSGLRRTYDIGAPALGLVLTSSLLRKSGAGRIALPGHELQWNRKGTKRPQSKKELTSFMNSEFQSPEAREGLKDILDNWDRLSGVEVRKRLRAIRAKTGQHFIDAYGIPKVVLDRNYRKIPIDLGAKEITANEAFQPTPVGHMATYWGAPEPETLLALKAYDLNMPKLDHVHPLIEPMTKKEVAEWKEEMIRRGHDMNKLEHLV